MQHTLDKITCISEKAGDAVAHRILSFYDNSCCNNTYDNTRNDNNKQTTY